MVTITDIQRENILHQTSSLIDYVTQLHDTFATSNNISDKALADWHSALYQAQAVMENVELQVKRIEGE